MIEKLIETKIEKNCPNDLEQKWKCWIDELNKIKNNIEIVKNETEEYGRKIDFYFDSILNTKIYTRLYYSSGSVTKKYPLIVYFHGSMSPMDREWVLADCLEWVKDGFSVVIFDARNQDGNTIDQNDLSYKDEYYFSQGIDNLETNYCKRLYLDGIKLIDLIKDPNIELFSDFHNVPLIALGASQGGEMSLAISALTDDISLCVADIPSGCALKERVAFGAGKYNAVNDLKKKYPDLDVDKIIKDLGYFDIVNFAWKINCPVFSAVGSADNVCPAEYFYKAYENIKTPKLLYIYGGYGHGGFDRLHRPKKIKYIKDYFKI